MTADGTGFYFLKMFSKMYHGDVHTILNILNSNKFEKRIILKAIPSSGLGYTSMFLHNPMTQADAH